MRSMSISVGRLFGVDVRLHLTLLLLPLFLYGMEYAAHKGSANGSRDMALAGIILACIGVHECGHMLIAHRYGLVPKAVILLPLTGVTIYDESKVEKPQTAELAWKRELRITVVGPLVSFTLALLSAGIILGTTSGIDLGGKFPFLTATNLP